jgi:hypothetical protein
MSHKCAVIVDNMNNVMDPLKPINEAGSEDMLCYLCDLKIRGPYLRSNSNQHKVLSRQSVKSLFTVPLGNKALKLRKTTDG